MCTTRSGKSDSVPGTLFNESAWFSILEKVVSNFESQQISMSRIFNKFILSESSLVNRAYSFFEAIYGQGSTDKLRFLKCREISIKTLGVFIVMHSKEKAHQSILEVKFPAQFLFQNLNWRLRRKIICGLRVAELVLYFEIKNNFDLHKSFLAWSKHYQNDIKNINKYFRKSEKKIKKLTRCRTKKPPYICWENCSAEFTGEHLVKRS